MLPNFEFVEGLINKSFFPQENTPAFQIPNVFDLLEEGFHFFFIEPNKVNDLVVLFSELLESLANVVFHFVEEEKVVTESLHHTLDFLLQHRRAASGINDEDYFLLDDPEGLELKCVHFLDAGIPTTDPVNHPAHAQQVVSVDHADHVRDPAHLLTASCRYVVQVIFLALSLYITLAEKRVNSLIAGNFLQ